MWGSSLIDVGTTWEGNSAAEGGVIYAETSTLEINNATARNNTASSGEGHVLSTKENSFVFNLKYSTTSTTTRQLKCNYLQVKNLMDNESPCYITSDYAHMS